MLFRIDNKEIVDFCEDNFYVGIISIDEFENIYWKYHVDYTFIERCKDKDDSHFNTIYAGNDYLSGIISLINNKNVFSKKDRFGFFIFKNVFIVVVIDDADGHVYKLFDDTFIQSDEKNMTLARIIYLFFYGLIINDYKYIERLQEDIDELDKFNSRELSVIFMNKLKMINKELLLYRNYYENLVGVGEELQIDYYHFFNKEDIRYMEMFVKRVTRLSDNIALLQELSAQSRETHQSYLDYSMNKTMEFFTVITSIFMPLTLLTGWYGMNFKYMPELEYKYSYYILMAVSAGILSICIWWFKKKKYF